MYLTAKAYRDRLAARVGSINPARVRAALYKDFGHLNKNIDTTERCLDLAKIRFTQMSRKKIHSTASSNDNEDEKINRQGDEDDCEHSRQAELFISPGIFSVCAMTIALMLAVFLVALDVNVLGEWSTESS